MSTMTVFGNVRAGVAFPQTTTFGGGSVWEKVWRDDDATGPRTV
jgi:hypothetical protein